MVATDLDGDGLDDIIDTSVTTRDAAGMTETLEILSSRDRFVFGMTTTTLSSDGLTKSTATDLDGDFVADRKVGDVTVVAADSSRTRTITTTSADGTLLSQTVDHRAADGLAGDVSVDSDGDGVFDSTDIVTVDGNGVVTETKTAFGDDGTLLSKSTRVTSADGLSTTVGFDHYGRATSDRVAIDRTVVDADGSATETTEHRSADGTLIDRTIITTSADGMSETRAVDTNGDGAADRVTSTVRTLNADGSQSNTREVRSGDGTLLSAETTHIGADRHFTDVRQDTDGDGQVDLTETTSIADDEATTVTTSSYSDSGALLNRRQQWVASDGLSKTLSIDTDGDGVYDRVTTTTTELLADGGKTVTTSTQAADGTVLKKQVVETSGNGFSVAVRDDLDGDGVYDRADATVTTIGDDGAWTSVETLTAGTGIAAGKTTVVSADGLTTTQSVDADGDGTIDLATTDETVLQADGSVIETLSRYAGDGALLASVGKTTSADGNSVTTATDLDGDGNPDEVAIDSILSNGTQRHRVEERGAGGRLLSSTVIDVSQGGLDTRQSTDLDGDGVDDLVRETQATIADDGTVTTVTSKYSGASSLDERSTKTVSADGFDKSVVYADGDGNTLRSYRQTTTIAQDGSTDKTAEFFKADGALESRVETITSGDGRTVTATKDIDGDGIVDQDISTQLLADGSSYRTLSDYLDDGVTLGRRTTVSVSGNGLLKTTLFDGNGDGQAEAKQVEATTLGNDGNSVIERDYFVYSNDAWQKSASEMRTVSGNGRTASTEWDDDGDGVVDEAVAQSAVLNADGSTTQVDEWSVAGQTSKRLEKTVSANGLESETRWDLDGDGSVDETGSDIETLNADGSVTETSSATRADGSVLSIVTRQTSADGKTVETTELSGVAGIETRMTRSVVRTLADGSTVTTKDSLDASGQLQERVTTTVSDDGRQTSIDSDVDGDGIVDHKKTVEHTIDGRTVTRITTYLDASTVSSDATVTEAADGLSSTMTIDKNGDGKVDITRTQTNTVFADGGKEVVLGETDEKTGKTKTVTTITSADGLLQTIETDVDGDGVADGTVTRTLLASGAMETRMANNQAARDDGQKKVGQIYWNDAIPAAAKETVSADGLTTTTLADLDDDGRFEVTSVANRQIDGSVVTDITETNADGSVKSRGLLQTSRDGTVTILSKDADNDGFYEYTETVTRHSGGGVSTQWVTKNATGAVTGTMQTDEDYLGNIVSSLAQDGNGGTLVRLTRNTDGTSTRTNYNTDGAVVSVDVLDADNVFKTVILYDPDNRYGWSEDDILFDENGHKLVEVQHPDGSGSVNAITYHNGQVVGTSNSYNPDCTDGSIYVIRGNNGNNRILGGDSIPIFGRGGNDTLFGGANSPLFGEDGDDILFGGRNSRLFGGAGNDTLFGGANNSLSGEAGDDKLYGVGGNNTLYGGAGNDRLTGGDGNDILDGGDGDDILTGGGGADIFVVRNVPGLDTFTDFSPSLGDMIKIDASSFGIAAGADIADYLSFGSTAPDGDHGYFLVTSAGISWDQDGTGAAPPSRLAAFGSSGSVANLSAADFRFG